MTPRMSETDLAAIVTALSSHLERVAETYAERAVQTHLLRFTNPEALRAEIRNVVKDTFNEEFDLRIGVTIRQKT